MANPFRSVTILPLDELREPLRQAAEDYCRSRPENQPIGDDHVQRKAREKAIKQFTPRNRQEFEAFIAANPDLANMVRSNRSAKIVILRMVMEIFAKRVEAHNRVSLNREPYPGYDARQAAERDAESSG